MNPNRIKSILLCFGLLVMSTVASAWWDAAWKHRERVSLDSSASGGDLGQPVDALPVLVRLHSGNFRFEEAKPDGSDLRFVAADDKTPLAHHVEQFDAANGIALVWVRVPKILANNAEQHLWLYHGNPDASDAADVAGTYDEATGAVLHLGDSPVDAGRNKVPVSPPASLKATPGAIGGASTFAGDALRLGPSAALARTAGGALSVSMWLRPSAIASGTLFEQGTLKWSMVDGRLVAQVGNARISGGTLKVGTWQHVALTLGERSAIYVDGVEVASAAATLPALPGEVVIGAGLAAEVDELQIDGVARSPDWVRARFAAEGIESSLVVVQPDEAGESSGGHSYFGILIDNLTTDAWVVIGILLVMFAVSVAVMVGKARFIAVTARANADFIARFSELTDDLTALAADSALQRSSLHAIYDTGVRELRHRLDLYRQRGQTLSLTPQAIDAVKASMDATLVRQSQRLNQQMVLLTIAISGGPFLGLLGTVVGVMITFAAIAAAGDVNVNAIAPGIAAALLATVAGLGVAIPALFGYNYLASRIKNIGTDMQAFADELITKIAESYSA
ncbi:MAG: hypothetical protein AMXMBFR6_10110 [Betaproteobacteria bacterium]